MKRLLGYGTLLWGFLFAVGSALYPWSAGSGPTFHGILWVTAAVAAASAAMYYLRTQREHVLRRALTAAVVWPLLCVILDFLTLTLITSRVTSAELMPQLGSVYVVIAVVIAAVGIQRHFQDAHGHYLKRG